MANEITTKVVLRLVDEMSGQVKAAVNASKPALEQFGAQAEKLGRSLESIGTRMAGLGGGVQLGLSRFDLDINSVATASVAAEKALYSIASTAGKSGTDAREAVASWGQTINQVAVASNQAQAEVITAFQDLVSKGISDTDAQRMLEPIGRAATAAGADIKDIASAANASFQNLGIEPERLGKALDIMAQAGKSGAFELRDMAQYFDSLTVKSALLGSKGEAALGQLSAAAQIARMGAGDASTAANNLANFLDKLSAPVTAKAFEKFGLNLGDEVKKGLASGDLIGYMGQLLQNVTPGRRRQALATLRRRAGEELHSPAHPEPRRVQAHP
jgi:TP901 family phage tail tape measure protein